jgi:hypothetical protein
VSPLCMSGIRRKIWLNVVSGFELEEEITVRDVPSWTRPGLLTSRRWMRKHGGVASVPCGGTQ